VGDSDVFLNGRCGFQGERDRIRRCGDNFQKGTEWEKFRHIETIMFPRTPPSKFWPCQFNKK
jgi:hypothetical protein